uniref:Ion transport domain-containing protein n=1 Tax=Heterosigma akashiwo TaxID=2829 RepID=A0A7S3Y434_HETAK
MVVNALLLAMPSVMNVVLILVLFFFIFAVVGLTMFSGLFYYCNGNGDIDKYSLDREDCTGEWYADGVSGTREWTNLFTNFDNIGSAFVATFELASLEMWPTIMWAAVDVPAEADRHPRKNNNPAYAFYFVAFIICGAFFITNLFVGVVINKFLEIKKKTGTNLFLTQQQMKWVRLQKQILARRPLKVTRPPRTLARLRAPFYYLLRPPPPYDQRWGDAFEVVILLAILANVLIMAMEHYDQAEAWDSFFRSATYFFTGLFGVEALIKIVGLGPFQYWRNSWNKFDLAIVLLSFWELATEAATGGGGTSVNLSIFRVLRTARVLRLVKKNRGLKDLFQTLVYSLASLVNVGSLLVLLIFVYGVMGMNLFGEVANDGEWITEFNNFRTFVWSVLVLFRCATGESWNGLMHELMRQGHTVALPFFVTYALLCNFLLLNLFIAVILENFAEIVSQKKLGEGLEAKHVKEFNKAWIELDPGKTLFVPAFELVTLLYALPQPLGLRGSKELDAAVRGQQWRAEAHRVALDEAAGKKPAPAAAAAEDGGGAPSAGSGSKRDSTSDRVKAPIKEDRGSSVEAHIEFMLHRVRGLHLRRDARGRVFYLDVLSALSRFAFGRGAQGQGGEGDVDFSHLEEDQVDQLTKELVTLSNHYKSIIQEISDDLPELDLTDEYNAAIGLQVLWRGKRVREATVARLKAEGRWSSALARFVAASAATSAKEQLRRRQGADGLVHGTGLRPHTPQEAAAGGRGFGKK